MSILFDKVARNICSILINRPAKRNALDLATIKQLQIAFEKFENDGSLHVAIIGGVGGNFCAGYDLNEFIDHETCLPDLNRIKQMQLPKLSNNKITIAAIDGHAAGAGFELALKCDLRVAEKESRMGFLNRRLGIPIMNGGTVILPQLIGHSKARELILTGKAQLANEALASGTIHYTSDIGCVLGRSINLARSIAKFNQSPLQIDLSNINSHLYSDNSTELCERERRVSLEYLGTCEPLYAVSKFLKGELYRHGKYDMGNLLRPDPLVTL